MNHTNIKNLKPNDRFHGMSKCVSSLYSIFLVICRYLLAKVACITSDMHLLLPRYLMLVESEL